MSAWAPEILLLTVVPCALWLPWLVAPVLRDGVLRTQKTLRLGGQIAHTSSLRRMRYISTRISWMFIAHKV